MLFDVAIIGGGFAGLTLARQLNLALPGISIVILEKREDPAPVATHGVGESVAELGSCYLRDGLQLGDYLDQHQLPKFGFRLFFSSDQQADIAQRVELGSKVMDPLPAHHIDRGIFERALLKRLTDAGVKVCTGARVKSVDLSKAGHVVHVQQEGQTRPFRARWVVDASGRRSLLKRKLGLGRKLDHQINAVWFRLDAQVDIDHWSDQAEWRQYLDAGRRRLATNHLMGVGYWVWIIPLVSGHTSVGIVADPSFHPFRKLNTFEKALRWLNEHEPLAGKMLRMHAADRRDFKVMKNFAHDTRQFYSKQRWGLTGDSGAFLDPFYSPGADFIALSNSWLTELITRDIRGEDIQLRTLIYDQAHRELFRGWSLLYRHMYGLFGKTQVMLFKTVWDWATYWAVTNVMFRNGGYTDIDILKEYALSVGRKFAMLNEQMQRFFMDWSAYPAETYAGRRINSFDLDFLHRFHFSQADQLDKEDLMPKLASNLAELEQIAVEMYRMVRSEILDGSADLPIDPYRMRLDDRPEDLAEGSKHPAALGVSPSVRADLEKVWLEPVKKKISSYA